MKKEITIFLATLLVSLYSCKTDTNNCSSISGYEVINAETALSNSVTKQLEIKCPKNKYAIGAGWSVEDPTSAILDGTATYFQPSFDGRSWLVNAKNNSAFAPTWKLRVRCICAEVCVGKSTTPSEIPLSDTVKQK